MNRNRLVRALRSAAATPAGTAATAAGCTLMDAETVLGELRRGRCNQIAAKVAASEQTFGRAMSVGHQALAPPRHRLAAVSCDDPGAVLAGAAGWTGHSVPGSQRAPRCVITAAAAARETRQSAATHSQCPPAIRWAWVDDWLLPLHGKPPPSILRVLSASDQTDVRDLAIRHRDFPSDMLRRLAGDDDAEVRRSVAINENSPKDVLRRLARDDNVWVRSSVALNLNVPNGALIRLARDNNADVRVIAAHKLHSHLLRHEPPENGWSG